MLLTHANLSVNVLNTIFYSGGEVLDSCRTILDGRGVGMPASIMVQADNTCREQRNQTGLYFLGFLASNASKAKFSKYLCIALINMLTSEACAITFV